MDIPKIAHDASIADAIDVMQQGRDRGVVVVDDQDHVLGILTEGDVVRLIRLGLLLETQIDQVLTGRVRLETAPLPPEDALQEFADNGTLLIPLVNSERRLYGVQRTREAALRVLRSTDAQTRS